MINVFRSVYRRVLKYRLKFQVFRLKRNGISIGENCQIATSARIQIRKGGNIKIGDNCEILDGVLIFSYGGNISIGNNCSINPYTIIYGHGGTTIGNNVLIAGGTMIIPNTHKFEKIDIPISQQGNESVGITVGDDVWIGHGCSILDGVVIEKGAIVAAGAVVNKKVSSYSIVGGVPAREIGKRK